MPVKIEPYIVEELASLDLVIWEAKHPKLPVWDEKRGKHVTREDKSWVLVSLAGPGVEECRAGARTLRQAVDAALTHFLADRVPGLRGAMMRLEKAMFDLQQAIRWQTLDSEYDDDIPF